MRKTSIVVAVLLALTVPALAGCQAIVESAVKSGVEQATGVKVEGDSVTVNKDGKEVSLGAAEDGKLPEGFPEDIPMFDPLEITSGMKASADGKESFTVTAKAADATLTDVHSFYKDELAGAGWTVKDNGVMEAGGAGTAGLKATKGDATFSISIVKSADGPTEMVMNLEQPAP